MSSLGFSHDNYFFTRSLILYLPDSICLFNINQSRILKGLATALWMLINDIFRAFVNNVWYIKILSPEDVQKLGKQEAKSLSRNTIERMHGSGADGRDHLSGFPSLGSLEYWVVFCDFSQFPWGLNTFHVLWCHLSRLY